MHFSFLLLFIFLFDGCHRLIWFSWWTDCGWCLVAMATDDSDRSCLVKLRQANANTRPPTIAKREKSINFFFLLFLARVRQLPAPNWMCHSIIILYYCYHQVFSFLFISFLVLCWANTEIAVRNECNKRMWRNKGEIGTIETDTGREEKKSKKVVGWALKTAKWRLIEATKANQVKRTRKVLCIVTYIGRDDGGNVLLQLAIMFGHTEST